jgi:amino acid adenylation domain-containing protein
MKQYDNPGDTEIVAAQFEKERDYWQKQLAGDYQKAYHPYYGETGVNRQGEERETATVSYSTPVQEKLVWMSNDSDILLHMLLMAAQVYQLHVNTGHSDIIIGMPIYRQDGDAEYINTVLPIRVTVEETMTFKELLFSIKQAVDDAVENQNYPLQAILNRLNLRMTGQENPLFEHAVQLEGLQDPAYLRHVPLSQQYTYRRTADGIGGDVKYDPGKYDRETILRLIRQQDHQLQQALYRVDEPLQNIDPVPEEEKKRIAEEFNKTGEAYPVEKQLHHLFEEQAAKTPHHIVQEYEDEAVTYLELNRRANRKARQMKAKGLRNGEITAIVAQRGMQMAEGLFAILKAGGAYVPIEPIHPLDGIAHILRDVNTRFLLYSGERSLKQRLEEFGGPEIIEIENKRPMEPLEPGTGNLTETGSSSDIAYVIYTSGTTGRPKGTAVEHRSIVNTITWRKNAYKTGPQDAALQLFSYAFDGFITSYFTPVVSGTRALLVSQEAVMDVDRIKNNIQRRRVTHMICVPTLYRVIMESLTPGEARTIKVITLAGDRVASSDLELARRKNAQLEIVNEYGVTEAAVLNTINRCRQAEATIAIGRPIGNTRLTVVNSSNRMQPIGIYGELCITGPGVARGYINNLELTAEKFYEDAGDTGGWRTYRTGDRARWLPEGKVELSGRIDHQVKLRGYRIEPGEIENRLQDHHQVKEAVVMPVEKDGTEKYLAAYVVPADTGELSVTGIREHLSRSLPDYMIPAQYISLEKMPRTVNGKVDRRALLTYGTEMGSGVEYAAPEGNLETRVAQIWQEVLKREKIGIDHNFFDMGGNSLNIVHVKNRLEEELETEIPIVILFQYPTIRTFSRQYANHEVDRQAREQEEHQQLQRMEADIIDTLQLFD